MLLILTCGGSGVVDIDALALVEGTEADHIPQKNF